MTKEEHISAVQKKYAQLSSFLNERTRRCWAATEATAIGRGGIAFVCAATHIDHKTVRAGIKELENNTHAALSRHRIRRPGGGRKKLTEKDPTLSGALDALVEPDTRGDPETPLRWTIISTTTLADMLTRQGHTVTQRTVCTMLHAQGYSLQSHRKTREGTDHPDRDAQFRFVSESVQTLQKKNQPVISVDAKKKEIIGNFKNAGQEWREKGRPREVAMHDFPDPDLGKVTPYGIYDLEKNEGWVSVGIDHDTASFAVASIKRWWKTMGRSRYPHAKELLITADCGGSNGNRTRLWKKELQMLADETRLTIHVRHFPPGTSKWNKIEHRLFSCISKNWQGKPLITRQTVVNLIANTKTKSGLIVKAALDTNTYATGIKVSDKEMAALNLFRESFHGEWNYRIEPR